MNPIASLTAIAALAAVTASCGGGGGESSTPMTPTPTSQTLTNLVGTSSTLAQTINYTIAPSGGDFTTIQDALNQLNISVIGLNATVTLTLNDGVYTNSRSIDISSKYGAAGIKIAGQHAYTTSVSSVQSYSGSSGAWSIVLNVASTANITTNSYVGMSAATGGTNPTYLDGVFAVTNVDAGKSQITIASTHKAAAAPSGNVTGTLYIFTSVLKFTNSDGFDAWNGSAALVLNDVVLVGDNSATHIGLSCQDLARCYVGGNAVGVVGFGAGNVFAGVNSQINGIRLLSSGSSANGFTASSDSSIFLNEAVASGNGGQGAYSSNEASLSFLAGGSTGNAYSGFSADIATMSFPGTPVFSTGNSNYGFTTGNFGYISRPNAVVANNGVAYQNDSFTLPYGAVVASDGLTVGANTTIGLCGSGCSDSKIISPDGHYTQFWGNGVDAFNANGSELQIMGRGEWFSGTVPTLSSCGTSPSVDSGASRDSGTVTTGSDTLTSCTVTFDTAFTYRDHCVVTPETVGVSAQAGWGYSYTKSAITVVGTNLSSIVFDYRCEGI